MSNLVERKPDSEIQLAIIEIVKRTDIDPERLEKFLDLQIKMEARQAERDYNEALAAFQGECPIIPKTKNVNFKSVNYDYTPIEEIVGVIRPILQKYKLSFSFNVKEATEADKMELITKIRHASGHCEETSYFFNKYHDDERMNKSQQAKSAVTYSKRAALENALGIVTEKEDNDARKTPSEMTSEQLAEINTLLKETKSDTTKVLKFIGAESLESLNGAQAKKAIHALKQKAGK
jgi:hypothetical protein